MRFLKISYFVVLCLATLSLAYVAVSNKNEADVARNLPDFESLSWKEKLFLFIYTKLSPASFKGMPEEVFSKISEYPGVPRIDSFFVDARQLFTQVKKVPEGINLPEFNWMNHIAFCLIYCFDIEVEFTTKNTKFTGVDSIKSSTEITPTSISNTFEIPLFNWTSPGFLMRATDYIREQVLISKDCYYSFQNTTIAFSADYHFVPEVGIQLENLSIYFNAGRIRGGVSGLEIWDFNGNLTYSAVYDREKTAIDEQMMQFWGDDADVKRKYTSGLQYSLNCFLSNGRSDPGNCKIEGDDLETQYYKLLNLQLIQTLGLGALLN